MLEWRGEKRTGRRDDAIRPNAEKLSSSYDALHFLAGWDNRPWYDVYAEIR